MIAGLILLPILVYRAHARREASNNTLDRIILLLTTPIEKVLSSATQLVSDRWYSYVDLRTARAENIELRRSLVKLDQRVAQIEVLEQENQRLRTLLLLGDRNPALELLTATVIAYGHSPLERTISVDRGLNHGVRRGQAVLTEDGLVGRVQRVGYLGAEVLLIADERVSLDVVVARSRARGRLKGSGLWPTHQLQMLHVLRTEDVQVGDRVETSGLGGVFPKGIPVGLVSRSEASPDGQELLVEVTPHVDFTRIEQVLVVRGPEKTPEELTTPELLLPDELKPTTSTTTAVSAEQAVRVTIDGGLLDAGARIARDAAVSRADAAVPRPDAAVSRPPVVRPDAAVSPADAAVSPRDAAVSPRDAATTSTRSPP